MEFLCQGNFVGVFSGNRDAFLALHSRGPEAVGDLWIEDPDSHYEVRGECRESGLGYAEFWFTLVAGGRAYEGTIYRADDGQVYIEGEQDVTGIYFVMRRD